MNYISTCWIIFTIHISDGHIRGKRFALHKKEVQLRTSSKITLTLEEQLVNTCLMSYKHEELDNALNNPKDYKFSRHYFSYKNAIQNSITYKIIKDMPKGAVLHVHDLAILGPDYLMNLTYMANVFVCFDKDRIKMKFAPNRHSTILPKESWCKWTLMAMAREKSNNVKKFNEFVRNSFTLVDNNPDVKYPSINHIWDAYTEYLRTVESLLTYRPVWQQYLYDSFKAFREQNILYVEARSHLPILYELNGTLHEPIVSAEYYNEVLIRFIKDYPDFIGAKLIYAPLRQVNNNTFDRYLVQAREIKYKLPSIFAGFDLVGQEELGPPLLEFLEKLSTVKDLNFFFHAGETNWYGTMADENLVDAILLGAKRIGHAFALVKHPFLIDQVLKKDIAIEVNVISNTVFSLVTDVRNHPLSIFLALGLPVVLSSDAPGAWEADPISHDFYAAFLGATSKSSDLRLLKTLALNSLKYSALNEHKERNRALKTFHRQWDGFIADFNCSKYNPTTVTLICINKAAQQQYCKELI